MTMRWTTMNNFQNMTSEAAVSTKYFDHLKSVENEEVGVRCGTSILDQQFSLECIRLDR